MKVKFSEKEVTLKDGSIIQLREAEEKDAEQILKYLNRVGGESDNLLFGENEFTMPLEQEREFLKQLKFQKKSLMLLAFLGEKLVSVASLTGFEKKPRIAHRGEVALSVVKTCWGRGIGRSVLEALISYAKEIDLLVLQLEVKADNNSAISLYESLGFEKLGIYRKFFSIDGKFYDAYPMNLYL